MAALTFIASSLSSSSAAATHGHFKPSSVPVTASLLHCLNPSQRPQILEVAYSQLQQSKRRRRSYRVITYAGPTTFNYVFAFIFPLSLIAVTVFTSIKIADELDRKFLEEVAVNQEILEAEEGGSNDPISLEGKPDGPRKRNRPKREAEASSM